MTILPTLKPKDVIRTLESAGFIFVSQQGSHRKFTLGQITLVVPFHTKDMRPGTLRHIIKQSGLSMDDFLK